MESAPSSIKLTLVGSSGAGKTSLRQQFLASTFAQSYKATIGADFVSKTLTIDGHRVSLSIWDTAGQDRFRSLANAFYRGSDACVLVYSQTDPASLQALRGWFDEFVDKAPVDERDRRDFCWVAVGNKSDLDQGAIAAGDVEALLGGLLPPLEPSDDDGSERGYSVDGPAASATATPAHDDSAHPPVRHHRPHSTTIEVLPPLEPVHETSLAWLPPGRQLSLAASRSASDTGTMHSSRTTQSIYHSASSSTNDTLSSSSPPPSSYRSAASFQSSASTLRPPPSPSPSSSGTDDSFPDPYFVQTEALSQRQRDLERSHGIDTFMSSSPPRAPPSGLPSSRFSHYRNPHDRLLRDAADSSTITPHRPGPDVLADVSESPDASVKSSIASDEYDYAQDGIRHFVTSAKTGQGVRDVFEYAVRRVLWRWARERSADEAEDERARRAEQVVDLGGGKERRKWSEACCS